LFGWVIRSRNYVFEMKVQEDKRGDEEIAKFVGQGMALTAWQQLGHDVELREWAPGERRELAAKLANGLGNYRLGECLRLLNARQFPDQFQYVIFEVIYRVRKYGAHAVLPELELWLDRTEGMAERELSDLYATIAWCYSELREFQRAHHYCELATSTDPVNAWARVEEAQVLAAEDRYEDSLQVASEALSIRQWYRPAVEVKVSALRNLGRDQEAEDLLLLAHEHTEESRYAVRLELMYSDRGELERARWALEEWRSRSPMMDKHGLERYQQRLIDYDLLEGEEERALSLLASQKGLYHRKIYANLLEGDYRSRQRVQLEVPFIRQHHMTCAPATLASLSRFWGADHDHLEIAEQICYDGTPWFKERQWMEEHGFIAREFRLTRESLEMVIDRGLPFTLTTSWTTGAHLQACIGYDARTGVAILRDPTHRHYGEVLLAELLESHPLDGPHATLMVPEEKAALLDGLELPDEEFYDLYHQYSVAGDRHETDEMYRILEELRGRSSDHFLTRRASLDWAYFLGDPLQQAQIWQDLLARSPDNQKVAYRSCAAFSRSMTEANYLEWLKQWVERDSADPVFYAVYGEELLKSVTNWEEAGYYLKRAVRGRRYDGRVYESYARYASYQGDFTQAKRYQRQASLYNSAFEPYAMTYFEYCIAAGCRDEGIDYLRERVEQSSDLDSGPWISLASAYNQLGLRDQSKETLEEALLKYPEDGVLIAYIANQAVSWGEIDRGHELLQRAQLHLDRPSWLDRASRLYGYLGEREKVVEIYQELITINDRNFEAHEDYAYELKAQGRVQDASDHLESLVARYPGQSAPLLIMARWWADEDQERALQSLERLLESFPSNLWALRQAAIEYERARDLDLAEQYARRAVAANHKVAESHGVLASVLEKQARLDEAWESYGEAIKLDVDYEWGLGAIMALSHRLGRQGEALLLIEQELMSQVTNGDGLLEYLELATPYRSADEVSEFLSQARDVRGDLWQSHTALVRHKVRTGELGTALAIAREQVERFALTPRVWMELAYVYHALQEYELEIEAAAEALKLSPSWDVAARCLSEASERLGRYDRAEEVLRAAVQWNPFNPLNALYLAELLWRLDQRTEAFSCLQESLVLNYNYQDGWGRLADWSRQLEYPLDAILEENRARRGQLLGWWMIEIDIWYELNQMEKLLEACNHALDRFPTEVELYDRKAFALTSLSRYDEAEAACDYLPSTRELPRNLQARKAWVLWESLRRQEAIDMMQSIIASHPDYVWPLRQLTSWLREVNQYEEALQSAQKWVAIEPENYLAWGHLAEGQKQAEKIKEAQESFERALHLSPTYSYGASQLIELYINEKKYNDAKALLETVRHYQEDGSYYSALAGIACAEGRQGDATEALRGMIESEDTSRDEFARIDQLFADQGWRPVFQDTLHQYVSESKAKTMWALVAWCWDREQETIVSYMKRIRHCSYDIGMKVEFWSFIIDCSVHFKSLGLLKDLEREADFKSSTYLWGRLTYAYFELDQPKMAQQWSHDYQTREDVRSWMMSNKIMSALALGSFEDAREEVHFTLANCHPDQTTTLIEIISGILSVREGDLEAAISVKENLYTAADQWEQPYLSILEIMILALQQHQDLEAYNAQWAKLQEARQNWRESKDITVLVKEMKALLKQHSSPWSGPQHTQYKRMDTMEKKVYPKRRPVSTTPKKEGGRWNFWVIFIVIKVTLVLIKVLSDH